MHSKQDNESILAFFFLCLVSEFCFRHLIPKSNRPGTDSQTVPRTAPIINRYGGRNPRGTQLHFAVLKSAPRCLIAILYFKTTNKHPSDVLWLQHWSLLFLLLVGCWHDSALWLYQLLLQEIRDRIIILEGKQFPTPTSTQSAYASEASPP